MKNWIEKEILNDFNSFRSYSEGVESLTEAIMFLGIPKEYWKDTAWEYEKKLIKDICPDLSYEFIDKFDDAIRKISGDRLRHGLETKEPLPKDFDYDEDNFTKIKEYIKREGYDGEGIL